METLAIVWLVALIAFAVLEIATTQLVSIWFVFGSAAALVVSLFDTPFWVQALVFVAVSALLLVLTRPLMKKLLTVKVTHTNADRYVGQTARVTSEIDNDRATGEVKVFGLEWTARASDDSVIPVDTLVVIERIEGVKLFVHKAEEPSGEDK